MDYYNSFMNQMEKFFYHLDKEQMTDDEVMEKLFTLKEEECKKESQMNKLIRWIPVRMQRKVDEEVNTYIKEVHFNIYENDDKQ